MNLNRRAAKVASRLVRDADFFGARSSQTPSGATVVDCGIEAPGGFAAGLALARICMGGLGSAALVPNPFTELPGPAIRVATDRPLEACMASQYAGWKLQTPNFFAMGSGPMRALGSKEKLLDEYDLRESSNVAVGVLESRTLPGDDVVTQIAEACGVSPREVTLLVAPTASVSGAIQIAARSVETAMHKLETLGIDLRIVKHGYGVAPLPSIGTNDLVALGRTNDSILYGADVTLWVDCEDAAIADFGPRVPSESSRDHGEPFGKLFDRYDRDFYKIDPNLFSPAIARFVNLRSGRAFSFGTSRPDLLVYDA